MANKLQRNTTPKKNKQTKAKQKQRYTELPKQLIEGWGNVGWDLTYSAMDQPTISTGFLIPTPQGLLLGSV